MIFYLQPKTYQLREVSYSILGNRSLFDNKFVKNDEEGKEVVDQVADIRTMLNDFDISSVLTDVSASTSTTVKGIFLNESEEVYVIKNLYKKPKTLLKGIRLL